MAKKYGLFNIQYLGASIYCDEQYKIDALRDFVLGLRKNYFVNKDYITEKNKEDILLFNTTYYHEARHVHEHLLCPILNYMLRLNVLCSLHAIQFFINWKRRGNKSINFIPIPLNEWFRLDKEEKLFNQQCWESSLGIKNFHAPEITIPKDISLRDIAENIFSKPTNDNDSLNNLLIISAAYYEEYKNFKRIVYDQGRCEYSIRAIIESSAFVCQMTAISLMFGNIGESYVRNTISDLFESKQFTVYTGLFTFIFRYLCYTGFDLQYQYPVTSYILFWCLNGNVLSSDSIIDPIKRLDLFTQKDLLHGVKFHQLYNSPLDYFANCDKAIGSTSIDYDLYQNYIINDYDRIIHSIDDFSDGLFSEFSPYIESIKNATVLMIEQFIDNPSKFLMPQLYLENIYDYANVPVKFIVDNDDFSFNLDEISKQNGILVQDNVVKNDKIEPKWIAANCPRFNMFEKYEVLPPTADDILLTHQINEKAHPYLLLSDSLFSPLSVTSPTDIIKSIIPDIEVGFIL